MKEILVETSARHIHLSQEAVDVLFGKGYTLTNKKDLSQPGQFACAEKLEVVGPKGKIKASILGPTRPETQVGGKEITVTVVHSDGAVKEFTYKTDAEYLGDVITAEGLVEGVEGPYGLEIHAVDGEGASWEENQSYWALFIGEDYATTGADGIVLEDGGVYKLVYTIG